MTKENILIVLASMQMYLDNVDELKGSFLYSKEAKYYGNKFFNELEKKEKILTKKRKFDTNENYNKSMFEYTQISHAVETLSRRIFKIDSNSMQGFNNDMEMILRKYNA